jgi:hypothetical protein
MISHILASARYARVLRLLDLERKLILAGPLSGLKELVDRREAALAEILENETELPEAFLVALKARAERNSRLILASLAGVKAGAAQVEQIQSGRDQLRTYAPNGERIDVAPTPVTRDQRA